MYSLRIFKSQKAVNFEDPKVLEFDKLYDSLSKAVDLNNLGRVIYLSSGSGFFLLEGLNNFLAVLPEKDLPFQDFQGNFALRTGGQLHTYVRLGPAIEYARKVLKKGNPSILYANKSREAFFLSDFLKN